MAATKVAILGGGMGALATALELTHADRTGDYDVTIYQEDWRLGGKGASTRSGRPDEGERVEEHGIHVLVGFYDEALRLIRSVYDEAKSGPWQTLPDFEDVLLPWNTVWLADDYPPKNWREPWKITFPKNNKQPGATQAPTLNQLVVEATLELDNLTDQLLAAVTAEYSADFEPMTMQFEDDRDSLAELVTTLIEHLNNVPIEQYDSSTRAIDLLFCRIFRTAWRLAEPLMGISAVRHIWIGTYLLVTTLRGIVRDRVLIDGYETIDGYDFREWLKRHECFPVAPGLSNESPPVLALYDLSFSRTAGLSAGTTLFGAYRMLFGYAGNFIYKMRAGMGDTIFAPIHEVLKDRGVEFKWLHEVTEIQASRDGNDFVVDEIQFQKRRDWETMKPSLDRVTGADGQEWRIWPSDPPPESNSPTESHSIKRGDHFDICVLGIAVGGLSPGMVSSLRNASPDFANMIDKSTHVGTLAMQLWLDKTSNDLGWQEASPAMLISYERPFNSWVDMTHVLEAEGWGQTGKRAPLSLHYFADELLPHEASTPREVRDLGTRWLKTHGAVIWPNFDFSDLHDELGRDGEERMNAQHFMANHEGSERYVTFGPGSIQHRIEPGGTDFRNLAIVGDWVKTSFSTGCLESAVLGGLDGATAIIDGRVSK